MSNQQENQAEYSAEEKTTIDEMVKYSQDFIDKRFPNGLNGDIRKIMTEMVLDAFVDGAAWQQKQMQQLPTESLIIQP